MRSRMVIGPRPVVVTPYPYETSFQNDENPISEGGRWFNRTGTFSAMRSVGGNAIGTHAGILYDDSVAHLEGFPADQYIEGTIYRSGEFTENQETQLLLRCSTSADYIKGYEFLINPSNSGGASGTIARWDGPMGSGFFNIFDSFLVDVVPDGTVFKAQIVGNTITVYRNGALVKTTSDPGTWGATIPDGSPGIACFTRDLTGEQNTRFGWKSIVAGAV